MSGILAVAEREMRAFLRQPIAWVVMGVWLVVHGMFFVQLVEQFSGQSFQIIAGGAQATDFNLTDRLVRPLLVGDSFLLMLLLPALTMRQLADEWRSGTSDLLMTYPLTESQIVLGKFLATAVLAFAMVAISALHPLVAGRMGTVEIPVLLLGHFGVLLYAWSVVAIGLAMSAWTENQVLAFVGTLMVLLALTLLGFWGLSVDPPWDSVLRHLSSSGHVGAFGYGILRVSSVAFFVSLSVFFLYLATGALGRRRWGRKA